MLVKKISTIIIIVLLIFILCNQNQFVLSNNNNNNNIVLEEDSDELEKWCQTFFLKANGPLLLSLVPTQLSRLLSNAAGKRWLKFFDVKIVLKRLVIRFVFPVWLLDV